MIKDPEERRAYHRAYMREWRKKPENLDKVKASSAKYRAKMQTWKRILKARKDYERKRRKKPAVRERKHDYNREYMRRIFALARAARKAGLEPDWTT